MHRSALGYKNPKVDKWASGMYRSEGYNAIRGREQQMIDFYGGVGSPKVGNSIRGVSKVNPSGKTYWKASTDSFGEKAPFTGYL